MVGHYISANVFSVIIDGGEFPIPNAYANYRVFRDMGQYIFIVSQSLIYRTVVGADGNGCRSGKGIRSFVRDQELIEYQSQD